jgi:hypothetical protein
MCSGVRERKDVDKFGLCDSLVREEQISFFGLTNSKHTAITERDTLEEK